MYPTGIFLRGWDHLPIEQQADAALEYGFDEVEIVCRNPRTNVPPADARDGLPKAAKIFRDRGLGVCGVVTNIVSVDEPETRGIYEGCAESGIPYLRLGGREFERGNYRQAKKQVSEDFRGLEKIGREFGVQGCMQIHSGPILNSSISMILESIGDCDPKYLGIAVDPGHLSICGEDAEMYMEMAWDYTGVVYVKNPKMVRLTGEAAQTAPACRFLRGWKAKFTYVDEGLVHWPDILRLLKRDGYQKSLVLHCDYEEPREVEFEMLQKDLNTMKGYLKDLEKEDVTGWTWPRHP